MNSPGTANGPGTANSPGTVPGTAKGPGTVPGTAKGPGTVNGPLSGTVNSSTKHHEQQTVQETRAGRARPLMNRVTAGVYGQR